MYNLVSLAGMFILMIFAWTLSENRRVVNWRVIIWGCFLQIVFALFIFIVPYYQKESSLMESIINGANAGLKLAVGVAALLVAFLGLMAKGGIHNPRSVFLATYALCGFAHFASLAIFVGGIAALVPKRTAALSAVGPRALLAATLACLMTASVAGIFYSGSSILFGN